MGLRKGGNTISKIHGITGKVLSNPITQAVVQSNPELEPFYAGALGANKLLGLSGQTSTQLSGMTNRNNYSGNRVAGQILQRGKKLDQTRRQANNVEFV
jgi:hypothetical protein